MTTRDCPTCGTPCEIDGGGYLRPATEIREALTQLLVAAQHQRDVRPGAVPQLLAAIRVAEAALTTDVPTPPGDVDFAKRASGDGVEIPVPLANRSIPEVDA